jgi:hypothetical protein
MKKFDPNHFDIWGGDNRQKIDKCLNCKRPKCNNCLEYNKPESTTNHYRAGYVQIKSDTGEVVGVYRTAYEAAEKTGFSATTIYKYVNMKRAVGGYIWVRKNEYEGEL